MRSRQSANELTIFEDHQFEIQGLFFSPKFTHSTFHPQHTKSLIRKVNGRHTKS